ncbi:MAG: alcohol dehydrogenase catalytic domain-containing protein [Bryobacteraceae bacterium]
MSVPTMQVVHLEGGQVTVKEAGVPPRPKAFALVRVLCAGICNTDLELQRGYYGFAGTPGHEFVGDVVECDTERWHGRRVVGEINLSCGRCEWCRRGWGRHCPHRTVLGIVNHPGAFAQYVLLPERNLHEVPDSLADEQAVFIEPLAAACEILDQVDFPEGATVAVLGDGKLGLLIAQVLHAHGLHAIQYGRHPEKLKISEEAGVETVIGSERLRKRFDFVIDSTGSKEGLKEAAAMTRPRGTVILKSTVHGEVPIDTAPVIVDELTLVGSRCGRFEPAIALLRAGRIKTAPLLSAEFPLERAADAFTEAAKRGVLKVLLRPWTL